MSLGETVEHADGVHGREIPEATVARLPIYLRALTSLAEAGIGTCSSEERLLKSARRQC